MNPIWADCGAAPGPCLDNPEPASILETPLYLLVLAGLVVLAVTAIRLWRSQTRAAPLCVAVVSLSVVVIARSRVPNPPEWGDGALITLVVANLAWIGRRFFRGSHAEK